MFIIQWIIIKFCDPLSLFLSIYIYLYLYLGLNNLFSPQMSDSVHGNIMGKRERPNFFLSPSPFYSIDTHTNRCGENKCSAFMTIRVSGAILYINVTCCSSFFLHVFYLFPLSEPFLFHSFSGSCKSGEYRKQNPRCVINSDMDDGKKKKEL